MSIGQKLAKEKEEKEELKLGDKNNFFSFTELSRSESEGEEESKALFDLIKVLVP
jgi:hypothetical protein